MKTMAPFNWLMSFSCSRLVIFMTSLLILLLVKQSSQVTITFQVQEEIAAPVRLGNLGEEAGITNQPSLIYSISSKDNYNGDLFSLNPSTGEFSTAVKLDREGLCGYVPKCVLTTLVSAASSSTNYYTRFTVNVTVQDTNDQAPEFKQSFFQLRILESQPVNSTFELPVAVDKDVKPSFRVKGYRLKSLSSSTDRLFDLVHNTQTSGLSTEPAILRLRQELDREKANKHLLNLVAFDGGNPPNEAELSVQITVLDTNDNPPDFKEQVYRLTVPETHQVNTPIKAVTATDKDEDENGRVSYEFPIDTTPRARSLFRIEKNSGDITLIRSLDKEGGSIIPFKVSAFDHGNPSKSSTVEVVVTVKDTVNDPPSIKISPFRSKDGNAIVSESVTIGTKFAYVDVEDSDSTLDELRCSTESNYFEMHTDSSPNSFTLSVHKKLNRESDSEHTVVISCSDKGNPPMTSSSVLTVIVEDSNDNPPVFNKTFYNMSVKENREAGRKVGIVSATDGDIGVNGKLYYYMDEKIREFTIDDGTGVIQTAVRNLDREKTSSYTFKVYAKDMSSEPKTATTTVMVKIEDVNDVWPLFDKPAYQFNVSENMEANRIIGVVHATDPDQGLGGTVKYEMISSAFNGNLPFSINLQDGSIVLTKELDYEKKNNYTFYVSAIDLGTPSKNTSVRVKVLVVDENDHTPVIEFPSLENLSVTLNIDATPGHQVVRIRARDLDTGENGRLTYSIMGSNSSNISPSELFWINEDTGMITLLTTLTKDDVRKYNVIISVRDNGSQQRATQAILQVNIVQNTTPSNKSHNMTIVIIMVCVTLFVAIIVLSTLCFIKYTDKRNFNAANKDSSTFQNPKTTTYSEAGLDRRTDVFFDTVLENSPSLRQKQPLSSSSSTTSSNSSLRMNKSSKATLIHPVSTTLPPSKSAKKCVTFHEDDVTFPSEVNHNNIPPPADPIFSEPGGSLSTFKPSSGSSRPPLYDSKQSLQPYSHSGFTHQLPPQHHHHQKQQHSPAVVSYINDSSSVQNLLLDNSAGNASLRGNAIGTSSPRSMQRRQNPIRSSREHLSPSQDGDRVVDFALQHHNALVRSMRGRKSSGATQPQQSTTRGHSSRDATDVCSSSSVETNDSGHGSELDVSVVKANV